MLEIIVLQTLPFLLLGLVAVELFGGFDSDDDDGGSSTGEVLGDSGSGDEGDLTPVTPAPEPDPTAGTFGDDTVELGDSDNSYRGFSGNDTISGGAGDDALQGGPGVDSISGDDGNDSLFGNAGDDLINGGRGDDFIDGGPDDDVLNGGSGNDFIVDRFGESTVSGGDGDDVIGVLNGPNTVYGGAGDDTVVADAGENLVIGGTGDDDITVIRGDNRAFGGDGDDVLKDAGRGAFMSGGAGDDVMSGKVGRYEGDEGDDILASFNGTKGDTALDRTELLGGDGDDALWSTYGKTVSTGGAGADTFYASNDTIITDFEPGTDKLEIQIDFDATKLDGEAAPVVDEFEVDMEEKMVNGDPVTTIKLSMVDPLGDGSALTNLDQVIVLRGVAMDDIAADDLVLTVNDQAVRYAAVAGVLGL